MNLILAALLLLGSLAVPATAAGQTAEPARTLSRAQQPSAGGQNAQEKPQDSAPAAQGEEHPEPKYKRIFGVIPNYRTSPSLVNYKPLTPRQKFKIALEDSFDRGSVILAAAFAGERLLTNATPSFQQGAAGYARYFGTAYADVVVGNFMTEAIFPTLLHQDPRYFRRGTGSGRSRIGHAMGQIFRTHTDSGAPQFNFSEVVGNSTAVAISNAYYPDNRTPQHALQSLGIQLGIDMGGNILKEFWPDLVRRLHHKKNRSHDH